MSDIDVKMTGLRVKWVGRYDGTLKCLRLFRVMWERGAVGSGSGYSSKVSIGLVPRLANFEREFCGWTLDLCFIRVHHVRSYGGIFT